MRDKCRDSSEDSIVVFTALRSILHQHQRLPIAYLSRSWCRRSLLIETWCPGASCATLTEKGRIVSRKQILWCAWGTWEGAGEKASTGVPDHWNEKRKNFLEIENGIDSRVYFLESTEILTKIELSRESAPPSSRVSPLFWGQLCLSRLRSSVTSQQGDLRGGSK